MQSIQTPLSLYLHIPFCRHRCSYCAFNTYTDLAHRIPAYVDALCRELEFVAARNPHPALHTVYFGGGTPSLLAPAQLQRLMDGIGRGFSLAAEAEISLEANPDNLDASYLRALRGLGFNRLSIGMQSADARILRLFEREHDLAGAEAAFQAARAAGFDNINLDVIFGSPEESLEDWAATVNAVLRLAPEHVSMYGLELKGGTKLRALVDSAWLPAPDDDVFADMYELAAGAFAKAGYVQYEISNWSRAGKQCAHSLQYWRNLPYLGLGAGAHGFAAGIRTTTIAAPERYAAALEQPDSDESPFPLTPATAKHNRVSPEDEIYETLMMGLRLTREGVNLARFQRRFGLDFASTFRIPLDKLRALGLIEIEDGRVRVSPEGRLLNNSVIRELVDAIPALE